jgi:hypothetical protein
MINNFGGFGSALSKQEWLLNFDASLMSADEAKEIGFPGSVVWHRRSYLFGVEVTSSRYYLTQVVDEHGQRIEPAWGEFVKYQNSDATGQENGRLFYHSSEP